jgi:hypothetical protein
MFFSNALYGSEVLKTAKNALAVSHPSDGRYEVDETVCVMHGNTRAACGKVAKVTNKGALVRLSSTNATPNKGDKVVRVGARKPSAANETTQRAQGTRALSGAANSIGAGFNLGLAYQFPVFYYERAFGRRFGIRIEPTYFSASGAVTLTAMGAKLGFSFHHKGPFEGLWLQAGAGYYSFNISTTDSLNATVTESLGVIVGTALAGYRFILGRMISLGIGCGIQYMPLASKVTIATVDFGNIQGIGAVNLGVAF